ncbi:MAG: EF-P lysine aminoacylase EpmA [Proteobacteria bacterium]|nr:EF-P lysine aminoacylase EpmA [Pseudomonadota bacterium]
MAPGNSWQPTASIEIIKKRAMLLQQIRNFMRKRGIVEVDTPILSHYGCSDPYIQSMTTVNSPEKDTQLYLHTSPEYCMKRLLAAGSGPIYQLAHVFRDEESGKCHNIEFTMLEWYRTGFGYHQLMDELDELLSEIGLMKPDKMTYAQSFLQTVQIDPHTVETKQLQIHAGRYGWETDSEDHHALLDFIFSEVVIKKFDNNKPLIIYDYPECMAALATLKPETPRVSERFELFIDGMEIANGFNELINADEQFTRFESDLITRRNKKLPEPPIDNNFIAALKSGLPESAGIAVGIDRLLMVLSGKNDINKVCSFTLINN